MIIDPWVGKDGLRFFLFRMEEDQELDALMKIYVRDIGKGLDARKFL